DHMDAPPAAARLESNSSTLRRTAAVVRYRRHVGDARDLHPERVQRAHRRFAAGPRTFDPHLQVAYAAFDGGAPRAFGGDLRGERRRLARALEAGAAGGRPRQRVPLAIGDRDDRVVERRVDVRDAFRDILLDLLAHPRAGLWSL